MYGKLKLFQQKGAGTACWCRKVSVCMLQQLRASSAGELEPSRSWWDSGAPGYMKNMSSSLSSVLLCYSRTLFIFPIFVRNSTFVCQEFFLLQCMVHYFVYILVRKMIFFFWIWFWWNSSTPSAWQLNQKKNYLQSPNGVSKLISLDCLSSLGCPKVITINDKIQWKLQRN